ncbi:MAG: hypothetical protein V3V33_13195 [Candidatus Lokiarchaeia archaeon]
MTNSFNLFLVKKEQNLEENLNDLIVSFNLFLVEKIGFLVIISLEIKKTGINAPIEVTTASILIRKPY